MKLKSLEIIGFKSFANKTKINFNNGLTEIVGPNGSGKSNVIEAIRWVLGEQSAKTLRGTKMPDIIFSGSSTHKAVNRAEVKLTLDNTDQYINSPYSEIIIARKLFRSGESQYSINNQECRLKDINNLFMDTGMGLGSFSIISQGNIEKIFNSKPEERRSIIETAAGVFKYKHQKHDANLKLSQTKENLDRVEDIIYELKDRNDSLKEQSINAKKYLKNKDALEKLDIQRLVLELKDLLDEDNTNAINLDNIKSSKNSLNDKINNVSSEIGIYKKNLENKLNIKEKLQDQLLVNSQKLEKVSGEQNLSKQDLNFKKKNLDEKQEYLNSLKQEKSDLNDRQVQYNLKIEDLSKYAQKIAEDINNSNLNDINKEIDDKNKAQENLKSDYLNIMQQISDLNNKKRYLEKSRKQNDAQNINQKRRLNDAKSNLNKIKDKIDKDNSNINALKDQYSNLKNEYDNSKNELNLIDNKLKQIKSNWYKRLERYQNLKIQFNSLKSLQDNHSNFYRGSQSILNAKNKLGGIYGAVSDYLIVDKDKSLAIETALGGQLQQIIVKNTYDAKSAVNYLNKNHLGRATFLPIDSLSKRFINSNKLELCKNNPGFIGVGSDLVSIDDNLRIIKEHLLGNVIIAQDLNSATDISNSIHHTNRVITLNGEIINAGGSITGGKNKQHYDGILSQKNKLVSLKEKFSAAKNNLQIIEQSIPGQEKAQNKIKNELDTLEDKIHSLSNEIINYKNNNSFNEKLLKEKSREIESIELLTSNNENDDYDAQQLESKNLKANLDKKLLINQRSSNDIKERLSTLSSLKNDLNDKVNNHKSNLAVYKEKINNYRDKKADNIEKLDQINDSINETKDLIINLQNEINIGMSEKDNSHEISNLKLSISSNKEELSQCDADIDIIQSKINDYDKKLDAYRNSYIDVNSRYNKLSNNHVQLSEKINKLKNKLVDKYKMNSNKIKQLKISFSYQDIINNIGILNRKISDLGHVNISSIEEYKDVSERYKFLVKQSDDLKNSSKQLTETMNKIDDTVKAKFKDTFDKVANQFKSVYTEIFGGGKAKLILTNPEDLLTTGIEIMAQPPGKKYRHMSLLSGGEKALTAISLLFAVLKVKPVPFCILDEAESALDAENVDRYANYMSKLDLITQFIIITHRKETMMYADTLYGVTMQNSGVSEVVSANLNKFTSMED
ncbi:chromosome segregation protein SMC [Apilactobacillus micheneri]|uniref:Chromosome partition protein Smc n=1 Tax=Apilactobacillus micheneri TaxID=1899430 RepID=A0ABY2Z1G0_9LACO|nr:chromosome segregation protein SMC [Apilactobacillus micheneri]TPR25529.1 chromosome segregation protein SMC [Apilactobacillus micheneri]TPR26633.1 chromosome segregation protein SMC [Apilactobacillus micheneri]TPR28420.1 chromosome segregation protein SMC [Apilactobacillus micheneri]TPR29107.1 chromosome segregation protein SMC [Apilactobacillus micheneri]TPR30696.1 chromosome segregation protein SMC [Apilactobacillus micheneri]